jgi:type VI protein secretion system component VasF
MKYLAYHHRRNVSLIGALARWVWGTAARLLIPRWKWAAVVLRDPLVRQLVARILLLVGLVAQCALLLVFGYLIDLSLSLMELWAELARKHMELTL